MEKDTAGCRAFNHKFIVGGIYLTNTKNEMLYIMVTRLLEKAAAAGLLLPEELATAKRLALGKYRPQTVWE
jgi:hypothetical protein